MGKEAARVLDKAARDVPVRNAATVIVVRRSGTGAPSVLMGQRGAKAAFMPNKFVFPGGALDDADAKVALAGPLGAPCAERLGEDAPPGLGPALAAAAIRELWEETGLILGTQAPWQGPCPDTWRSYAATGHRPTGEGLHFVFRALTPPGRPRRFDARFFLVDAGALASDPDDFSRAEDELSHLQWIPLPEVRNFDLPFITEVVLAEIAALAQQPGPPPSVPYFRNSDEESLFLRLRGHTPRSED